MKKKSNLIETHNLFRISDPYPLHWRRNAELVVRNIKSAYERIRYGVSHYDVWNLNDYIYLVIVNGLKMLTDDTIGHPTGMSANDWEEELKTIIDQISYLKSDIDEEPRVKSTYEAFRKNRNETTRNAWFDALDAENERRKEVKNSVFEWLSKYIEDLWW